MVVEAMKMQNEIKSPKAGKIVAIAVAEGVPVNPGQVLLSVE
jgi:biotin carboxyl carrier protein